MSKRIEYKGQIHEFPDEFSDDQIGKALKQVDLEPAAAKLQKAQATIDSPEGGKGYVSPDTPDYSGTGAWEGAKAGVKGVAGFAGSALKKLVKNESWLQKGADMALEYGAAPQVSEKFKADDYALESAAHPERNEGVSGWVNGPEHMERVHRIGEQIPVLGPIAAHLTEKAVGGSPMKPGSKPGDPFGAVAEGGVYVAQPEVGKAVGKLMKRVAAKAVYPNMEAMTTTPGAGEVNPVEAHTPLEIKRFADENKVPMTAAEILETGGNRALQGVGEKSATGSNIAKMHKSKAQGAVYRLVKKAQNALSGGTPTPETGAVKVKGDVTQARIKSRSAADTSYAEWRAGIDGPVNVNLADINTKYGNVMDTMKDVLDNIPPEQAGKLRTLIEKASKFGTEAVDAEGKKVLDPNLDIDAVRDIRSHWLETQRELARRGRADSREAGTATQISADLDSALEAAIEHKGGKAAVEGWRNANKQYKTHMDTFHGEDSVLSDIADTGKLDDPKLLDRIIGGSGGNPAAIRQLRAAGVDLGAIQRHVWDIATDRGFGTPRNRLGGLSDEFMQELFADNPQKLDDLYKTARIGRSVKVDSNPSNSGGTLASRAEVEGGIRAGEQTVSGDPSGAISTLLRTAVGYPVSKLTHSNWFKNWQTNVPDGPVGEWLTGKNFAQGSSRPGGGSPPTSGPNGGGGNGPAIPGGKAPSPPASSKLKKTSTLPADESGDISFDPSTFESKKTTGESDYKPEPLSPEKEAKVRAIYDRTRNDPNAITDDEIRFLDGITLDRTLEYERRKKAGTGNRRASDKLVKTVNPSEPTAEGGEPTVGEGKPWDDTTAEGRIKQGHGTERDFELKEKSISGNLTDDEWKEWDGSTFEGGGEEIPSQPTARLYHGTSTEQGMKVATEGLKSRTSQNPDYEPDMDAYGNKHIGPFLTDDEAAASRYAGRPEEHPDTNYDTMDMRNSRPGTVVALDVPTDQIPANTPFNDSGYAEFNMQRDVPPEWVNQRDSRVLHHNDRADIMDDYGVKQDIEADPELGNPRSKSVRDKLKKRNPEEREGIEDGVGPGAMLRKGSPLALRMGPGPSTGKGMKLYHGVRNSADTPKIMEEGLKPPKEQKPYDEWTEEEKSYFNGIPGRFNTFLTRDPKTAEWWPRDGDVIETEVPRSAVETTTVNPDYIEDLEGLKAQKTGEFTTVNAGGTIPPWMLKLRKKP